MKRRFFKYITNSALGMLGISLYILVDTFFISLAKNIVIIFPDSGDSYFSTKLFQE